MMASPVAGIDPHQDNFTLGIIDANGVELTHASLPVSPASQMGPPGCELRQWHGTT